MNLGSISDQLPTYPNNIQGELRLILQTKDIFLICYKHLEEYRKLVNEQNRLITKEFVQEQLQIGEDEISELKMELQDAESRLGARLRHNELLADHLASLGFASLESGASIRHLALCRSPQMRKNMLAQRQGGPMGSSRYSEPRPPTHMIDNIALAISEIHQEVRAKVKPLLDYYRDLFYLQLHFSLVLGQVCNYCMPLVTENIGLIDRIFFWSERPEFDLVRRAGDISDRLKEIYTRAQTVLSVLAESVRFLQSKVELQKTLEQRFHERLDEQQKTKDKILREVHTTKQNMDMLEEENDRLVGSLVKVDPTFVDSRHFYELAEGGNLMTNKRPGSGKDAGQNNAEERQETLNNVVINIPRQDTMEELDIDNRNNSGQTKDSNLKTADLQCQMLNHITTDVNNNKAYSIASDSFSEVPIKQTNVNKKSSKGEGDVTIKDVKTKISSEDKTKSSKSNIQKEKRSINTPSTTNSTSETYDIDESADQSGVPLIKQKSVHSTKVRSRSKSRRRDENLERRKKSVVRNTSKSNRRAVSAEKEEREEFTKKHRSKSSIGGGRTKHEKSEVTKRNRRSMTPEEGKLEEQMNTLTYKKSEPENPNLGPTLKSRLLGRTKDLLEAALRKSPKSTSTDQASRSGDLDSTETGQINQEEVNNEGVTSVSSFTSLLIPDSPLGEPELMLGSHVTPARQLQKKNRRTIGDRKKKTRSSKNNLTNDLVNPLPALSSEVLLVETPTTENRTLGLSTPIFKEKLSKAKSSRKTNRTNNLGEFLIGTNMGPLPSLSQQSILPSL